MYRTLQQYYLTDHSLFIYK